VLVVCAGVRVKLIEFEFLTAVFTKSFIVWDIMPCSPLNMEGDMFLRNVTFNELQGVISQKIELIMKRRFKYRTTDNVQNDDHCKVS
jgi:hypothetical protein